MKIKHYKFNIMNLKHYNKSITMSNKNIMHYAHSILYFMQKQFFKLY